MHLTTLPLTSCFKHSFLYTVNVTVPSGAFLSRKAERDAYGDFVGSTLQTVVGRIGIVSPVWNSDNLLTILKPCERPLLWTQTTSVNFIVLLTRRCLANLELEP